MVWCGQKLWHLNRYLSPVYPGHTVPTALWGATDQRFGRYQCFKPFVRQRHYYAYINAQRVGDLFDKLREWHSAVPRTIVLDNVRYQHCKKVLDYAALRRIFQLFFPAYSPNLNLIERLWKFIKKDCLHG